MGADKTIDKLDLSGNIYSWQSIVYDLLQLKIHKPRDCPITNLLFGVINTAHMCFEKKMTRGPPISFIRETIFLIFKIFTLKYD